MSNDTGSQATKRADGSSTTERIGIVGDRPRCASTMSAIIIICSSACFDEDQERVSDRREGRVRDVRGFRCRAGGFRHHRIVQSRPVSRAVYGVCIAVFLVLHAGANRIMVLRDRRIPVWTMQVKAELIERMRKEFKDVVKDVGLANVEQVRLVKEESSTMCRLNPLAS
ncbi:hypothetical protein H8S61_01700 [Eggerthella sp. NSJ-70]|uniref:Uncharacterized protein n=1 Tax=Eggerthella hominis TaxID=2763043 RepID=A0ABR7BMU0_9ACTN|nr:hypothetical protein [Eggerthella hominis]MBC5582918.1 hypothetical protein [Eggerthella hominis]